MISLQEEANKKTDGCNVLEENANRVMIAVDVIDMKKVCRRTSIRRLNFTVRHLEWRLNKDTISCVLYYVQDNEQAFA